MGRPRKKNKKNTKEKNVEMTPPLLDSVIGSTKDFSLTELQSRRAEIQTHTRPETQGSKFIK